jgi:hypothetical protein
MTCRAVIAALALAAASPVLAQSTLVLPHPGSGYQAVPPQGFRTQVLPMPGDRGWIVIPPPGQAPLTVILPASPSAC